MSFDFDDFEVRGRFFDIEERTETLRYAIARLNKEEGCDLKEAWTIAYIYHDCALDGMVLTHDELRAVCSRNVTGTPVVLSGMQRIRNHLALVTDLATEHGATGAAVARRPHLPITMEMIRGLHESLLGNIPRTVPGKWRADMPVHRTYFHNFSEPDEIEAGMEAVCAMTHEAEFVGQHPISQAAMFHHAFMSVFPFSDGAGTVGRILMNRLLMRGGHEAAVIHGSDRQRYYEALLAGPDAVRTLVLDSMEAALEAQQKYVKELENSSRQANPTTRRGLAI